MWTLRDFKSKFGCFSTLWMKGLIYSHLKYLISRMQWAICMSHKSVQAVEKRFDIVLTVFKWSGERYTHVWQTLSILMKYVESFRITFSLSVTGYLKSYFKLESFSGCSQLFQLSKERKLMLLITKIYVKIDWLEPS